MQINVAQLLKGPIGETREYQIKDTVDFADGSHLVEGEFRLTRTDRAVLVKGTLRSEVELACSRCLNSFTVPITLDIEEEYYPTIDIITGARIPVPGEPGSFTIDEHNILDLTEAVRQYALLAIPMKPLCREDCAGLCPSCGTNLNEAACTCPSDDTDPRWARLKNLVPVDPPANKRKGTK